MASEQGQAPERRQGREGSRWINQRPNGAEVADWFEDNVAIHDGLQHKDYVSGVTLIQQTEKPKEIINWTPEGRPVIGEVTNIVYVPYAKVEARVKYFQDLMRHHQDEWVGFIEPVAPPNPPKDLPTGFFWFSVQTGDNRYTRYICCSMKVTVYKRGTINYVEVAGEVGRPRVERRGEVIIDGAPATKAVPAMTRNGADNNAVMKAETGGVGRALGMAGMLVIPGTGVATAEDMAEAEALDRAPPPAAEASTPPPADERPAAEVLTSLRQQAATAINELKSGFPDRFELFREWASSRGVGKVAEIADEPMLRGLIAKAERELQEAHAEDPQPDPEPD